MRASKGVGRARQPGADTAKSKKLHANRPLVRGRARARQRGEGGVVRKEGEGA